MTIDELARSFDTAIASRDRMEALGVLSLLVGIAMQDPDGERCLEECMFRFAETFGEGEPSPVDFVIDTGASKEELQRFISDESVRLGDGIDATRRQRLLSAIRAYRKKSDAPAPMPTGREQEPHDTANRQRRHCKNMWWIVGGVIAIGAIVTTLLVLRDR